MDINIAMNNYMYQQKKKTSTDIIKKCAKDDYYFEKITDRYLLYVFNIKRKLDENNYHKNININELFPYYVPKSEYSTFDKNIPNIEIIAEYNHKDGFSKTYYNKQLNEKFVVKYTIKQIDPIFSILINSLSD
jgi:hypothetical protein